MPGAIDIVINLHTPEMMAMRAPREFLKEKIGVDEEARTGITIDSYMARMDRAEIEMAFITAAKSGPVGAPASHHVPYEMVAEVVEEHPDRFRGLAGIDPNQGMDGVRALEHAVREMGFIGAHLYPHWFGLPPNDRKYYPFYAKCCELDVPIQMQVGHCLVYTPGTPLKSVGRPILLDTIAYDFPELKLIGIHTGWPWVEEMISVAWKHRNVYIGSDAYAPKYWKPEFIHFINSWGTEKVLFGTDFPIVDFERATREIGELDIKSEARENLLWRNTKALYRL